MRILVLSLSLIATASIGPAFAEGGGDRTPAGGAFMSSYSSGPYGTASRTAAQAPNPGLNPRSVDDVAVTGSIGKRARRAR